MIWSSLHTVLNLITIAMVNEVNLPKSTQATDDNAESQASNVALKCTWDSINNMKVIYNRNLKDQAEMNEELYDMIHTLKEGQHNLYRLNDAINIKLDTVVGSISRHLSAATSYCAEQLQWGTRQQALLL